MPITPEIKSVTHIDHVAVGGSMFKHELTTDDLAAICKAHNIPDTATATQISVSTLPVRTQNPPMYQGVYGLSITQGPGCTSFEHNTGTISTVATADGGIVPVHMLLGDSSTSASFSVETEEKMPSILKRANKDAFRDAHLYEITADASEQKKLLKRHNLTHEDMVILNHHRRHTDYKKTSEYFADNADRDIPTQKLKELLASDCITEKSSGASGTHVLIPVPSDEELDGRRIRKQRSYISDRMTHGLISVGDIKKTYTIVDPVNSSDRCAQVPREKYESMIENAKNAFSSIPPGIQGKQACHPVISVKGAAMNGLQHNIDMHMRGKLKDTPPVLLTTNRNSPEEVDKWVQYAITEHGKVPHVIGVDPEYKLSTGHVMGEITTDMQAHCALSKLRRNDQHIVEKVASMKRTASAMVEKGNTKAASHVLNTLTSALFDASQDTGPAKETYAIAYTVDFKLEPTTGQSGSSGKMVNITPSYDVHTTDDLLGDDVPSKTYSHCDNEIDGYPEFDDEDQFAVEEKEDGGEEWTD